MAIATDLLMRGVRADQPAAGDVGPGALYCVTDEGNIVEQSDGAAWNAYSPDGTSLGLGTAATHDEADFLQSANDLSDLASPSTARTNLGLGTAAVLNVAASGDASSTEVVKGDDSRLGTGGSSTLAGLSDVDIASPSDDDVLTYEAASSTWKNKAPTGGGGGGTELFDDTTKSADYTVLSGDKGKTFVCTAGLTLTLPSPADTFWCRALNASSAGYVLVGSTIQLLPGESATVASDGTSYFLVDVALNVPLGSPLRPPASPNAADDEWYEAALDTGGTRRSGATALAWDNQGSATATVGGGRIILKDPANNATSIRMVGEALPAGTWAYVVPLFGLQGAYANFMAAGLALKESASSKYEILETAVSGGPNLFINRFTNNSTFSSTLVQFAAFYYGQVFFKIEYDGTNLIFSYSFNGAPNTFTVIETHAKAAFFSTAPDTIGLATWSNGSNKDTYGVFGPLRRVA